MNAPLIIGTRGSDLALWQARHLEALLQEKGISSSIKIIKTKGDEIQNLGFDKMEGKGFFTKEIEDALLNRECDIAVHSQKDLPTDPVPGLIIAGHSYRENPSDVLLIRKEFFADRMPLSLTKNARVGTSSSRRKAQLLSHRPDLNISDLRGNVPTRIQKLKEGKYDAILLAAAGIERLNPDLEEFEQVILPPEEFVPAPAQGIIAFQTREEEKEIIAALESVSDKTSAFAAKTERQLLAMMDGGCQLPLGVYYEADTDAEGNPVHNLHVSFAPSAQLPSLFYFFQAQDPEALPQKAHQKIKSLQGKNIFISREKKPHDRFSSVLEAHGFQVDSVPLIEIKPLDFNVSENFDWVFFSSKNAVKYFFEKKPMLSDKIRFGVIGSATAFELRKFGKRAEFIGQSTDTKLIGKQFSARVGKARVLFPTAKESKRSIQNQLTTREAAIDLPVYETLTHTKKLEKKYDILVFTSPSNVEAFFGGGNRITDEKVIAMGEATAHTIYKNKGRVSAQPPAFNDLGLIKAVLS